MITAGRVSLSKRQHLLYRIGNNNRVNTGGGVNERIELSLASVCNPTTAALLEVNTELVS